MQSKKVGQHTLVITIALGVFSSVMSTTMLAIAYPEVVKAFSISYDVLQWRNILFWSILSVGMPFFGKISEKTNAQQQFLCGLGLYCLSTIVSALATTWAMFLFAQSLQALADAMVVPVQAVLIRNFISEERIGWAFGWQAGVLAAASLMAPALGGLIIQYFSWHYIFWCLTFFGLLSLGIALLVLPSSKPTDVIKIRNLPIGSSLGFFSTAIAAQALLLPSTDSVFSLGWSLILVAGLLVLIFCELRTQPQYRYFPAQLWRNYPFIIAAIRGFLIFLAGNGLAFFLPTYLRIVHGYDAGLVGLLILIDPLITVVLGSWGGRLADRATLRAIFFGVFLSFIGTICLNLSSTSISWIYFAIIFIIMGIGAALVVPAQNKAAMDATPPSETGTYMGLFQMLQFISGGFAGAIFAPLIEAHTTTISANGFHLFLWICTALLLLSTFTLIPLNKGYSHSSSNTPSSSSEVVHQNHISTKSLPLKKYTLLPF